MYKNERSASVTAMKATGCIEEGILRNHISNADGSIRNSVVLSILKNEWSGRAKEHTLMKNHFVLIFSFFFANGFL
jgi:N-acetyltransferase